MILEQLGEAVVIGQQGFVQLLVADEHDLEVQGDRLRLDALGADSAVRHVARLLKARGTGAQGAEKPFPCAGMLENVLKMQDKETAVGPMQGSGLDQREIRDQRAHFRLALHAAKQVGGGGVVFDDQGGALVPAVVHKHVHVIEVRVRLGMLRIAGQRGAQGLRGLRFTGQETFRVIQNILTQGFKILFQSGIRLTVRPGAVLQDALHGRAQHGGQHRADHFLLQRPLVRAEGLLGGIQLAHHAGHGPQEGIALLLEPLTQGGIEMFVLVLAQALAFHQGIQGQAALLIHIEVEALFPGGLVHLLDEPGTHGLKTILQFGTLLDVLLVVQTDGQFLADIRQRLRKDRTQLLALPRRDGQQHGTIRIIEIVDVKQVRRRLGLADAGLEKFPEHVGPPKVRLAGKINIVPCRVDVQRQLQRLEGAGLRGHLTVSVARDGVARFPRDAIRGQTRTEALTRQRLYFTHDIPKYGLKRPRGGERKPF